MKKFKHLKKFNELNSSTYSSAAEKATEYGRKKLANRLIKHSDEISGNNNRYDNSWYDNNIKLNSHVKPIDVIYDFNYETRKELFDLKFVSTSVIIDIDSWNNSLDMGDEKLTVTLQFSKKDERGEYISHIIKLDSNVLDNGITLEILDGREEVYNSLKMLDRKSANEFRKLLKINYDDMLEFSDEIKDLDNFKEIYKKNIFNIPIHIFLD